MKTIIKYLILVLLIQPVFLLNGQENSDDIVKAYVLRMDGRTDEAISVLSKIIESDPTNAMAHFEMARSLENEKKNEHMAKAIDYDPNNLVYRFYNANMQMLEAYKAMKTNNPELIKENLDKCTGTLKSILEKKPDCKESLLFLIDIYGSLPNDMGGNIELAQAYLKSLQEVDKLYAAHGELIIKSRDQDVDMVKHWRSFIDANGESNEALIKLGKAYLMSNSINKAKACFDKVMKSDPNQAVLHLDVARTHLYSAMRGGDKEEKALKQFKKNINIYLNTEVKKPKLIQAWCYGWLGMVEDRQGNKKLANEYIDKAEKLIPNYPRFTAIPKIDQPPYVMAYQYKSYFSPF